MSNKTALPAGLPACKQYINFKLVPRSNGKGFDKVPLDQHGNVIDAHDPSKWVDAATAWASPFNTHGIGFVITPGWLGGDLDKCRTPDGWSSMAVEMCAMFAGAYRDVTPSGEGLRIIARAVMPDGHRCKFPGGEFYSLGRFVTITGNSASGDASWNAQAVVPWLVERHGLAPEVLPALPSEGRDPMCRAPEDDAELMPLMLAQGAVTVGKQFGTQATMAQKWAVDEAACARAFPAEGRSDGLPFDHSSLDMSIMSDLAYWTGRDIERMQRLFEMWPGYRSWKYQRSRGYHMRRIILRGCSNKQVYGGKLSQAVAAVAGQPVVQRRLYTEIEADIKALGVFVSNGAAPFIERIKPLMMEMITSEFGDVEVDMLLGEISMASGKQITKTKLNAAFKKLTVEVRKQQKTMTQGVRPEVLRQLVCIDETVLPIIANAEIYIQAHSEWDGVLGYDEFSHKVVVRKPLPWSVMVNREWSDSDTTHLNIWLQRQCEGMRTIGRGTIEPLPEHIARRNPFHAVRDYLNSLVWDGVPRLHLFAESYLGAVAEDAMQQRYLRAVCPRWFVGAVARVMQPGCKMDTALIIESDIQGFKKSTLFRVLATRDDWFSDTALEINSKDGMQQLNGVWIYELAELEAVDRKTVNANKQFMASQSDKFRPPYGRRVETFMRQCVLVGSTNNQEYLRDKTGNRRYWPIAIFNRLDLDVIRRDVHQLWAEAVHLYNHGHQWWFTDDEEIAARREQDERLPYDDMTQEVLEAATRYHFRTKSDRVTLDQIMVELRFQNQTQDRTLKGRIGDILKRNGFRYVRPRLDNPDRIRLFIYPRT